MKNYIHLNGQDIDLDIINTTQDLDKITDACIRIMGAVLALGTNGIKDDKERVEFIMTQAGKIGGGMARQSLTIIANEKSLSKESKPEKVVEDNANA